MQSWNFYRNEIIWEGRKIYIPEIHNSNVHRKNKVIGEMAQKTDTIYYMRRAETTGGEKDGYNILIGKLWAKLSNSTFLVDSYRIL